jgi:hypothetical protein
MSPDEFVRRSIGLKRNAKPESRFSLPEVIEAQLREDRVLPEESVDAITQMLRVAYRAAGDRS